MSTAVRHSDDASRGWGRGLWALAVLVLLALFALVRSPASAQAASSTVGCTPDERIRAQQLVDAVRAANSGGPSTVTLFPGCVYTVFTVAYDDSRLGPSAMPLITGNVTIAGQGAVITGGEGNFGSQGPRLFQVNSGATLVLQDLTIRKYLSSGISGNGAHGAAVYVNGGTARLTNTTLAENETRDGGGAGMYVASGMATLTNSTVSRNEARVQRGGFATFGGGLYVNGGTVTVTNSTVSDNVGTLNGGGLFVGGGTVTLTNSTVSGNLGYRGGGGLWVEAGTVTLTNSAVIRNRTHQTGGGLLVGREATVSVINSTVSGNMAGDPCCQFDTVGGGVYSGGTLTVTNSTISGNAAISPGTALDAGGGGLVAAFGSATLTNTLIAANTAPDFPNCVGNAIRDGGNNLQDQGRSCGATMPTTADARLAGDGGRTSGLDFNGGPTRTVALQSGSPAINAGNQATCTAAPVNNRDQRGFVRVGVCDIGAYESGASPVPRSLTVTRTGSGSGTVSSSPAGIACGATCQASFLDGRSVTLSAAPAANTAFAGWTGSCTGKGACVVPMTSDTAVGAIFTRASLPPPWACRSPPPVWP